MGIIEFLANNMAFMVEPWFTWPWFGVGIAGLAWVIYDVNTANMALNPPLKVCWPILIFFFAPIGIALYLVTSRPPGIGKVRGHEAKMRRLTEFSQPSWRKTVASATHCVAGDGLGIMTAMVGARVMGFSFWHEFWFEYGLGYLIGWLIFQTWAMRMHGNGWLMAIWMGGRAEFFSMLTVMLGMGLTMYFVTPAVVGEQPLPNTYAFWTFGALGLLIGFMLTLPMNHWLVSIGWKHGQGREYMLKKMDEQKERHAKQGRSGPRPGKHAEAR